MEPWSVSNPTNDIAHHGILGMKWGVRRTPEQLGHRKPTKEENRERKRLTKNVAASQRDVKFRTRATLSARELAEGSDKSYERALRKPAILSGGRAGKEKAVNASYERMENLYKQMEFPESRKERATERLRANEKALRDYVDGLVSEYGSENVKGLSTKDVYAGKMFTAKKKRIGELYIRDTIKTGVRTENLPIVGDIVSGKKISAWEKEHREELLKKRAKNRSKETY